MDLRDMFKAKGQKADKEKNKLGAKQVGVVSPADPYTG